MSVQERYAGVISLINQSGGREVTVVEENGVLKVSATVPSPPKRSKCGMRSRGLEVNHQQISWRTSEWTVKFRQRGLM